MENWKRNADYLTLNSRSLQALPRLYGKFSQGENREIESQKSTLIGSDVQILEFKNGKARFLTVITGCRFLTCMLSLSLLMKLRLFIRVLTWL